MIKINKNNIRLQPFSRSLKTILYNFVKSLLLPSPEVRSCPPLGN